MNVLPGGRAFLFGSIGHLGVYDLRGQYGQELDVPFSARFDPHPGVSTTTVDWDSVDNGAHITVVVLSKTFNDHRDVESKLSVFTVDYTRTAKEPSILRTHVFTLPISATVVSIKGALILVRSSNAFLLVNLEAKQRGCWLLRETESEIASTYIDPAQNSIILVLNSDKDNTRSLQIFDVPSVMESFNDAPHWAGDLLTSRTVTELARPAPKSHPTVQFFHSDSATFRESTLADDGKLLLSSTFAEGPHSPDVSPTQPTVKQTACAPSNVAVLRSAHRLKMLVAVSKGELAILPSTQSDAILRLAFPAERMPGLGRALAFDDVYGIMLVFARGRLFVVQY
ncbi:hypothetical protein DFH09DRAFT_1360947 [Mycena vulgaris]|nr:hypothetical protein DFH09DRAFT_1360947 [Mycena vulgaris]